jgi:hypothetical protein
VNLPEGHMKVLIKVFCALLIGSGASALAQTHWSMAYPIPTGIGLLGATYGNGLFVAVGFNDTILASADGIKWLANHLTAGAAS